MAELGAVVKNSDGHLGTICNYCGGYGFTNVVTGGSAGCPKCDQTGIQPISSSELLERIKELEAKLGG